VCPILGRAQLAHHKTAVNGPTFKVGMFGWRPAPRWGFPTEGGQLKEGSDLSPEAPVGVVS
jgi:hypothetical protein